MYIYSTYIHLHIYICIYLNTYSHVSIYISVYTYIYIYIYICISTSTYRCIYIYIYVFIHVHMYTHIYIYAYISAHIGNVCGWGCVLSLGKCGRAVDGSLLFLQHFKRTNIQHQTMCSAGCLATLVVVCGWVWLVAINHMRS
jgi:hypothetical protein